MPRLLQELKTHSRELARRHSEMQLQVFMELVKKKKYGDEGSIGEDVKAHPVCHTILSLTHDSNENAGASSVVLDMEIESGCQQIGSYLIQSGSETIKAESSYSEWSEGAYKNQHLKDRDCKAEVIEGQTREKQEPEVQICDDMRSLNFTSQDSDDQIIEGQFPEELKSHLIENQGIGEFRSQTIKNQDLTAHINKLQKFKETEPRDIVFEDQNLVELRSEMPEVVAAEALVIERHPRYKVVFDDRILVESMYKAHVLQDHISKGNRRKEFSKPLVFKGWEEAPKPAVGGSSNSAWDTSSDPPALMWDADDFSKLRCPTSQEDDQDEPLPINVYGDDECAAGSLPSVSGAFYSFF